MKRTLAQLKDLAELIEGLSADEMETLARELTVTPSKRLLDALKHQVYIRDWKTPSAG